MKLKFLGSADSASIPVHNCSCDICTFYRQNKKKNLPTSAYIEVNNNIILLDAGVENICEIFDGKNITTVFLTHFHADHCLGLLRLRYSANNLICYHPKDNEGFADLFKHKHSISYKSLEGFETIVCEDISFTTIPLKHSKNCLGYMIQTSNKTVAYLTDCSKIEDESMQYLKNFSFDYIFIDACYDERKSEGNHLNYLQATKILDSLSVKNGYLIHASHTTLEYIKNNDIKLKYPYLLEDIEICL